MIRRLIPSALTLTIFTRGEAWAYLDPGSVSLFFQALVAAFFGGLLLLKRYWHRIVDFLRGTISSSTRHDQD